MLMIRGKDPPVFLDGIRALLVTHCLFLSEPSRELGAIFSGMAFLLAQEALHTRLA